MVTKQHWPACKCLNKSCTEKRRIHPGLTANTGPKYCVSARSRQDKATQETARDVLGGRSGNAPLGHRHSWAFHFLLRDTSSGEQVCPDLINDCSARGNPGQTWISSPWHAVMGMAMGLELGMLLSHQQTQIPLAPVTCPCPCLTLALSPRSMESHSSCLQIKTSCSLTKCRPTACVGVRCTGRRQSF